MDKLILSNGNTINLEAGASLEDIRVSATDRAAMVQTWQQLTPENLADIRIQNTDGVTAGHHKDLVLVSESSTVADDGTVLTSYCLHVKTPMEKRLDALEAGQATQDGAIEDVAAATSALSEKGGKA